MEHGYHYNLIRRAIDEIDRAETPLTLEALAERMDMSPAHFQRLFSQWAGVSPKRYQQYLTLGHAKALLRAQHPTLATAHASGLSGTGRLHDLFLTWEAMRPGDYARGGAGLVIYEGLFDSPFGPMLAMGTDRGLCAIGFICETGEEATRQDLRSRWPNATFLQDPERISPWVTTAVSQNGKAKLHLMGGPFQIKVWEALLRLPKGHVTTYSKIAQEIGSDRAVRAVGTAVGRNPISWLIPCHRVIRKDGALGGYHWGLPVKRALLAWETAQNEATRTETLAKPR